ncbi:MAG: leucine--tRNA ligase, partial [Elusimicrobia bacterium]|nr:leucine--tRNA ligase [Candidatus Obscuribacterium magneticum]
MNAYNFKEIEQRWQKKWGGAKSHATPAPAKDRPPYYLLVMFPYPSGNLHMGHVRNYTIGDILARYYRKKGRAVLHPIGWDAFGMPAENAAIERGIHPHQWTQENIVNMRRQLKALGISYDWDREFATCDPDYYKWNQWFFIKMYEKGLVYRKKSPVNWCPKDATVLANEQVHNGRCWRCDSEVEQKELEQWFFKITAYAQELLDGHELLKPTHAQKGWPEEVLIMQKNWIGSSWGALVDFTVLDKGRRNSTDKLRVFTTRPDTLFGATFMVLAPEHPLVPKITTPDRMAAIEAYRKKAKKLSSMDRTAINREKTGEFTGAHAENPVNGEAIPIWIADYVLMEYGTGAIMAVPAHDERDFEFAKKFKIPIIEVIRPADKKGASPLTQAYIEEGIMANSGAYNGQRSEEAKY